MPTPSSPVTFTSVRFRNFKAFRDFSVSLQHVNILVGPNNCGKSTILAAFRVLAAGIQRAGTRQSELIETPTGPRSGYRVPLNSIPVSMENVHTNYEDVETSVVFRLSNGRELTLLWQAAETDCLLFASRPTTKPSAFKRLFPVSIGVIPTLGPVDHEEKLLAEDTVRRGLLGVRASAYFRNHWYHYPYDFEDFRDLLTSTWPGMDVERPTLAQAGDVKLVMFCKEDRTPRELYWAGFGFQVWCQTLTHVVRESGKTLVIIDEPEIYLHPELQALQSTGHAAADRRIAPQERDSRGHAALAPRARELPPSGGVTRRVRRFVWTPSGGAPPRQSEVSCSYVVRPV